MLSCIIVWITGFLGANESFNMSLRVLTRKAKMQLIPSQEDICSLLFAQARAQHACRLFLDWLKGRGGCTRGELSKFAWDLEAGKIEKSFTYRRTSFYRQIRRTLLTLGLIAIEQRFDVESNDVKEKYVAVW